MSHLVSPIRSRVSLAECERLLREAHDYLAARGRDALSRAAGLDALGGWGAAVKRVQVQLGPGAPALVCGKAGEPFIEVVNQCASLERLLDALAWAQGPASGLADHVVALCHPTTSSEKKGEPGNDLVLVGLAGEEAHFEVSDVASDQDGNGKELKDLCSLRVLPPAKSFGRALEAPRLPWPRARLFLVVAPEFADLLRNSNRAHLKGETPFCRYVQVCGAGAHVFEVLPGGEGLVAPRA